MKRQGGVSKRLALKVNIEKDHKACKVSKPYNRLELKGDVDKELQGMQGKQAMEQLKQSGMNDQQLQTLKNSGAIDQIVTQGGIDKIGCKQSKANKPYSRLEHKVMLILPRIQAQGTLETNLQKLKK